MEHNLNKLFSNMVKVTSEAHFDDSPVSQQQHLLNDIEQGICQLLHKVLKPYPLYVVLHNGLIFTIVFDAIGHNIVSFNVRDKQDFAFDSFVNNHGNDYAFSHVMFREHHHFIYVKPKDLRPWMKRTIAEGRGDLYWCIHRHFVQFNGPLPEHYKNLAMRKDLDVSHYLRDDAGVFYTKTTFDLIMSMTFTSIPPMTPIPS